MSARTRYEDYYGFGMLDDMHNFFPDLLYNNGRFRSVSDVFAYINTEMNENFNLYSSARGRLSRNVRRRTNDYVTPVAAAAPAPAPATAPLRYSYFDDMAHIDVGRQRVAQPAAAAPVPAPATRRTMPSMLFPGLEVMTSEYIFPQTNSAGGATAALASIASLLMPSGGGDMTTRNLMDIFAGVPGFSEPVPVRPTAAQVNAATTEDIVAEDEGEENTCAICQDDIAVGTTMRTINHCNHAFHKQCIDIWFAQNVHCPVCRHDIRDCLLYTSDAADE